MDVQWDENKAALNLEKHGVDFHIDSEKEPMEEVLRRVIREELHKINSLSA